jgi:outer membrane usher protein
MARPTASRSRTRADVALSAAAALVCGTVAQADESAFGVGIADAPPISAAARASNPLYLEAFVNGDASGLIVTCEDSAGSLRVPLAHLAALGLRIDDLPTDAQGWIALDAISGLSARYEPATQRLLLTVLAARRNRTVLGHAAQSRAGDSAAGALVNYDAVAEWQDGSSSFRTFSEQRLFGDWGVFSNGGTATVAGQQAEFLRLDSFWSRSDAGSMQTVTVGDVITRSLGWSRSTRLGGLQFGRNFALRPDLVTYPVAGFEGEAAVTSTVEVYVNEVRQLTGTLPAGPFAIEAPPSLNGAGQATLVVRDVLGRETLQTLDLYVIPQLLAPGLSDWSFEAGLMRRDFGVESNAYRGGIVGSASLRHGITERLTLETHAEGTSGLAQLGLGLVWQVGLLGRLTASAGVSEGVDRGERVGIGYQFVSSRFNVTVDWQHASPGFRDLPSLLGDLPVHRQFNVFAGWQVGPRSHLGAGYVESDGASPDDAARIASLGYRLNVGSRASIQVNAFRDAGRRSSDGVSVGWSMAVGDRGQMHSDYSSADERTSVFIASRSPYEGGLDWRLRASAGDDSEWLAASRYVGSRGAIGAEFAQDGDAERLQLAARGALVLTGNHLVAGRYVQDEFALVSTNGLPGVPVLHENRPAGTTNRAGLLLLPNVNAYQANHVAIDPLEIPFGYRLEHPERTATPRLDAGTLVLFAIDRLRAATFALVDASGSPLPAGSEGKLLGSGAQFVVGYDGIAFLSDLEASNTIRVATPAGSCEAEFELDPATDAQTDLGRLSCL